MHSSARTNTFKEAAERMRSRAGKSSLKLGMVQRFLSMHKGNPETLSIVHDCARICDSKGFQMLAACILRLGGNRKGAAEMYEKAKWYTLAARTFLDAIKDSPENEEILRLRALECLEKHMKDYPETNRAGIYAKLGLESAT